MISTADNFAVWCSTTWPNIKLNFAYKHNHSVSLFLTIKTGTDVCRNIKTIVFTTAKSEQMKRRPTRTVSKKKKRKTAWSAGKMGMNKSWFVLVLNLIGWQSSASFLNQLRSELKQTKEIPAYFHDSIQNFLKLDHIRAWQIFYTAVITW